MRILKKKKKSFYMKVKPERKTVEGMVGNGMIRFSRNVAGVQPWFVPVNYFMKVVTDLTEWCWIQLMYQCSQLLLNLKYYGLQHKFYGNVNAFSIFNHFPYFNFKMDLHNSNFYHTITQAPVIQVHKSLGAIKDTLHIDSTI